VELMDMTGALVARIEEKNMSAGNQVITWNTNGLPYGAYLVRVTGEDGQMTQPLIIAAP
jgi:hypothetical protein